MKVHVYSRANEKKIPVDDSRLKNLVLAVDSRIKVETRNFLDLVLDGSHVQISAPAEFTLFDNIGQWTSNSNRSSAAYLGFCNTRPYGLCGGYLLQLLRPKKNKPVYTSYHFHEETREIFHPLYGQCEIRMGDENWKALDDLITIEHHVPHQLRPGRYLKPDMESQSV